MIRLTRLSGQQFVLNSDLIKTVESTPDTVITLTQGEKWMVKENVDTVIRAVMDYQKRIRQQILGQEPFGQ